MDISDGMDKSWNHPWTTEEMRKKRREWSLAGDAGLLKHLQQFSENLTSRANKTDEALNSLTTQLNEAAILIDNVTNTSLALANTQFIESRVQEDDIEIEKKETLVQESKNEDVATADLIASVSESIREGLNIMDLKYKKMEFVDSDSEEESNGVVLSVVLGPNDPYQDRPLPYVIGSEQWKNSSKIGLESSSSSESEQVDEEEESESDNDTATLRGYNIDTGPKSDVLIGADYGKRTDIAYMDSDKLDVVSQNNMYSASESITPNDNTPKAPLSNNLTPNFAEELAKRLGTVRQAEKPVAVDDKSEASINRFKDDLFTPDGDENALSDKSKPIFTGSSILNNQASENLWKEKPIIKPYENNIIPASIDVPPPISTVSTKPKSAIDDLFADADSEDSDDIFSSKSTIKTIAKTKHPSNSNVNPEAVKKKYLDTITPPVMKATSTPESNTNDNNIFMDDDEDDLFGSSKNSVQSKRPAGGVSILGNILTSDMKNKLSSRMMRSQSSESSGSDTPPRRENSQESMRENSRNTVSNENNVNEWSPIVMGMNITGIMPAPYDGNSSSGISIHPPSINITEGSSTSVDFQPSMTSSRLKSEEIYRERVGSDSLFNARSRNPVNVTLNSNSTGNQAQEEAVAEPSLIQEDDVFENEELFGPPPLPKADSKPKSKVSFPFDDSDSGDELFSTTSSGSRSQKSTDFLTGVPQLSDKSKVTQRRGLFDEDIDIFNSKDSPDVDIFGIATKTPREDSSVAAKKISDTVDDALFARSIKDTIPKIDSLEKRPRATPKRISLFDDAEDTDEGDLFSAKPVKNEVRTESKLFTTEDDRDLFSVKKPSNGEQLRGMGSIGKDNDEEKSAHKTERKGSDILTGNGLFSTTIGSHGLIFEDDDYDDLFSSKTATTDNDLSVSDNSSDVKTTSAVTIEVEHTVPEDRTEINISDTSEMEQREKDVAPAVPIVVEAPEVEPRRSPPRSLDIQATVPSSQSQENSQAARRTVSGKIKNLMGKMGDLKILSPMDTPPLWRKSDEKADEDDSMADRDSDDGGCISTQGHSSPPSISEDSTAQKQSLQSTVSGESNVESAISFDEPAQVETLSTAASKTRVRIQAKRRPQSRHARKTALRQSGIDFDTVDASGNIVQDESHGHRSSNTHIKEPAGSSNTNIPQISSSDRLAASGYDNIHRLADPNASLAADEKSELGSISKESSMSANKNTLLSPSTDEEDLFDVPPDLPEDPQREDTLFGRAPILSPVDKVLSEKPVPSFKPLRDTHIKTIESRDTAVEKDVDKDESSKSVEAGNDCTAEIAIPSLDEQNQEDVEPRDNSMEVIDPLRDSSHDPLKDPSQLFAFVTKTPSPEKGKSLLFSEDDSLFSTGSKRSSEDLTAKKPMLDLFADDAEGDLFSASLTKPVKKPLKDTKISLFDDDGQDDEDDSLFGPVAKKPVAQAVEDKKQPIQQLRKKISVFDDDDDDANLFSEQTEHAQKSDTGSVQESTNKGEMFASITERVKTSHITDIYADHSSGEDDIFAAKVIAKKVATSKSLFPLDDDDDDDGNIFVKKTSASEPRAKPIETRSTVKKSVTRDLKKTAEKISEDPLSILQDD
ncbi:PWP1 homolog no child left behind [Lasioglossum baleicum]|uniref:PWP1 homolog no child left behind n=1 Tax=Lasioglossum baleicum TaxID=434251 RepID=UPI003FCDF431